MRPSRLFVFLAAYLFWVASAFPQAATLTAGPTTNGHVPVFVQGGYGQPIVRDGGGSGGSSPGVSFNPSEIGITAISPTNTYPSASSGNGPNREHWCSYDAPVTNATGFHYICLDANANGGELFSVGAGGGATPLPLQFLVNGVTYQFPFAVGGIVGPGSSTVGDGVCFNNTAGTLAKDCGPYAPVVATNAALRALSAGFAPSVWRAGYAATGDAPAMLFAWNASCPGSPDNVALYVAPNAGGAGCWSAAADPNIGNPFEFGAKCDSSNGPNYDTTAMQAWATAATNPNGNRLTLPAGCIVNGTITLSQPFVLSSGGTAYSVNNASGNATITQINATATTFNITTSKAWTIRDIGFYNNVTRTGGYDIYVQGDGVNIPDGFVIDNITSTYALDSIGIPYGTFWKVVNSTFQAYGNAGVGDAIYYPSTGHPDYSDVSIANNVFQSYTSGTRGYGFAGVYLEESQAVWIHSNKFIGGENGVVLNSSGSSGTLVISGNSFEQHTQSHLIVIQKDSSGRFANLIVNGNEFSNLDTGSGALPAVTTSQATVVIVQGAVPWGTNVVFEANVFNDWRTTSFASLDIDDGAGVSVHGNVFNLFSQTGPTSIRVQGNASNVQVSGNIFNGQTSAQHYGTTTGGSVMIDDKTLHYADLNAWANGSEVYCVDCTAGATLTGGGSGAWGRRINGAWNGN